MKKSDNYLNSLGKVLKEFKHFDTPGQTLPHTTILTPYSYGLIELAESTIQKLCSQKNILKNTFSKGDTTKNFTYIDFIMNEGFTVDPATYQISYENILSKVKEFFRNMEFYFAGPEKEVLRRNYYVLEYHLFHSGYDIRTPRTPETPETPDKGETTKHLVLFGLVDEKETLQSKLSRSPTAMVHPGQVLTMIKHMAKSLKYIFLESDLYFGTEDKKPLLPWSVEVDLTDIWVFGKWDYKLSLLQSTFFDPEKTPILNDAIIEEIQSMKTGIKYITKDNIEERKKLYSFSLNSLAIAAIKFTLNEGLMSGKIPDLKETMRAKGLDDAYLGDLEARLNGTFVNEFKEEAELLRHIISQMLTACTRVQEEPFDYEQCIKGFLPYRQRDPKEKLLIPCLNGIGWGKKERMKEMQEQILQKGDVPRDLELQLLSSRINDKLKKEQKFAARINDDKKETQKASGSQKSVVLPHLEVEYPLESADISNISQNSKNTDEKLVCQIYPLFEKDFFVYRALTSQLMLSIEFNDDLTILLSSLAESLGYINGEIDNERRIVFRSALTLQAFENEMESHINSMDHLVIVAVIIIRKLNYCIEYEEFGRIARNTKLIIDEINYHLQNYREQALRDNA